MNKRINEILRNELDSRINESGIELVVTNLNNPEIIENLYLFYYDSKKYLETGSSEDKIGGNIPIVINSVNFQIVNLNFNEYIQLIDK